MPPETPDWTGSPWTGIRRARLAANHLLGADDGPARAARPVHLEIEGVVRDVLGIQAQVASAAELALSARLPGIRRTDVREALWERRSIVRTWTVRGTIHLLSAADLPSWAAVMETIRPWEAGDWLARTGLAAGDLEPILEAVPAALDGQVLTRAQIADAVADRLGGGFRPLLNSMWGDLLAPLAQTGRICFGPPRGPLVTFVRTDRWLPMALVPGPAPGSSEAWRILLERFVRAYGPVATADVARWFGARPEDVEPILGELEPAVERVQSGRSITWRRLGADTGRDVPASPWTPASVRLLPQYDAYVLGSFPRESIVPASVRARIRTFKRGRFEGATGVPVLVVDGVVAGVWEHAATRREVEVRVDPFVTLSEPQEAALRAEADRIGRFLDLAPRLAIVPLAGP